MATGQFLDHCYFQPILANCSVDIAVFTLHMDLYRMETAGDRCRISSGIRCCYTSLVVTQPHQPRFIAWSALKKRILIFDTDRLDDKKLFLWQRPNWAIGSCEPEILLQHFLTPFISHPELSGWELKRFYRYWEIMNHRSKPERYRWLMNGVNQKNFSSFFSTWSKMKTAQVFILTGRSDNDAIK